MGLIRPLLKLLTRLCPRRPRSRVGFQSQNSSFSLNTQPIEAAKASNPQSSPIPDPVKRADRPMSGKRRRPRVLSLANKRLSLVKLRYSSERLDVTLKPGEPNSATISRIGFERSASELCTISKLS